MDRPQGELNNKFITISVSDSFRQMVKKASLGIADE